MASQFFYQLLILAFPLALLVLMVFLRRVHRIRQSPRKAKPVDQYDCGYLLKNLTLPRCPECGRVLGFQSTPEELGLTMDELQKIQAARERRKAGGLP